MAASAASSPVTFNVAGMRRDESLLPQQNTEEVIYKIPPPLWMIAFIIIGYLGMRFIMED